jgi:hypothetical protein
MARQVIQRDRLGVLTKIGQGGQGVVYGAPNVKAKFAASMVYKEYKAQTLAEIDFIVHCFWADTFVVDSPTPLCRYCGVRRPGYAGAHADGPNRARPTLGIERHRNPRIRTA